MVYCVTSSQTSRICWPSTTSTPWLFPRHDGVTVGCIKLLFKHCFCLPLLTFFFLETCISVFSCLRFVCSHECCTSVSSANDGNIADFLFFYFFMDLFTIATSITAFVVVIKFLLPRPRIIAGSHLAAVNHLLFPPGFLHLQLRTSFLTAVHSCASLNTLSSYFICAQNRLKSAAFVWKTSK